MSREERLAILLTFLWLASVDRLITDTEISTLRQLAISLDMPEFDPNTEIAAGTYTDPKRFLGNIRSQEAKDFLFKLMLHLCYCDGVYSALERIGLLQIAKALGESQDLVERVEREYAQQATAIVMSRLEQEDGFQVKQSGWSVENALKVAGTVVVGGGLLFATGGFAAPAVGGWIGSTLFSLSGAAAVSSGLAALGGGSLTVGGMGMAGGAVVVKGAFGLAGAAAAAKSSMNLWGELTEFQMIKVTPSRYTCHQLLCIHGFLQQGKSPEEEWRDVLAHEQHSEIWSLSWESKVLEDWTNVFLKISNNITFSQMAGMAAMSGLKAAGVMFMWPAALLSVLSLIDNPWSVAKDRAQKAGYALGQWIAQNNSPVSLLGYSLGSRVIAYALEYLRDQCIYGKVFDVYFMAGAVGQDCSVFNNLDLRRVVANDIFNVYSAKDMVLAYLYRSAELGEQPIGLTPLKSSGVINIDVTNVISNHLQYPLILGALLKLCSRKRGSTTPKFKQDLVVTQQAVEILKQVPGMTKASVRDCDHAQDFYVLRDGSTVKTWKNPMGVDHVFVVDNDNGIVFAGFVGWIHSDGLFQALAFISQQFS